MIGELIPTGYTYDAGRTKINDSFIKSSPDIGDTLASLGMPQGLEADVAAHLVGLGQHVVTVDRRSAG